MNEQEVVAQIRKLLQQGVPEEQITAQLTKAQVPPEKVAQLISQAKQSSGQAQGSQQGPQDGSGPGGQGTPENGAGKSAEEALTELTQMGMPPQMIGEVIGMFLSLSHSTIMRMATLVDEKLQNGGGQQQQQKAPAAQEYPEQQSGEQNI